METGLAMFELLFLRRPRTSFKIEIGPLTLPAVLGRRKLFFRFLPWQADSYISSIHYGPGAFAAKYQVGCRLAPYATNACECRAQISLMDISASFVKPIF